jgi:hypothetical protein
MAVMLEIGGFDERKDFVHTEDYDAWLRIAYLKKRFCFLNEPLGEYRTHGFNLSLNFKDVLLHEKNVLNQHFINLKTRVPFYKNFLFCNKLSVLYFKMGVQYFFRKMYLKSSYNLVKSFLLSPVYSIKSLFNLLFGFLE